MLQLRFSPIIQLMSVDLTMLYQVRFMANALAQFISERAKFNTSDEMKEKKETQLQQFRC